MHTETGSYPVITIVPNGQWRPDDVARCDQITAQLEDLILPNLAQDCFTEGQVIKALMVGKSHTWTVTRDGDSLDQIAEVHDCDECRQSRAGVKAYLREHPDAWCAFTVANYTAIVR